MTLEMRQPFFVRRRISQAILKSQTSYPEITFSTWCFPHNFIHHLQPQHSLNVFKVSFCFCLPKNQEELKIELFASLVKKLHTEWKQCGNICSVSC